MHDPQQAPGRKVSLCFRAAALCCGLFIVTVLATTAAALGDPAAPAARWLNRAGSRLIAWEVALTLLFGLAALIIDQRQTRLNRVRDNGNEESRS